MEKMDFEDIDYIDDEAMTQPSQLKETEINNLIPQTDMATPISSLQTEPQQKIVYNKLYKNTTIADLFNNTMNVSEFFLLFLVIIFFQIDYIISPLMKLLPLASRSFTLLTLTGVSVFRSLIICLVFFILRVFIG